jgi:hypothetical protein
MFPQYASGVWLRSRESDVLASPRGAPLVVAELGLLDRCDDGPVVADRAALESPPAKLKRLHRRGRNPDRRIEVAVPAANHEVATQATATQPGADGLNEDSRDDRDQTPAAPAIAPPEARAELPRIRAAS